MALSQVVINFLNENARNNGVSLLDRSNDLFASGVLDSFALVDFIVVLEEHCGISVPDSEVIPQNFRTIEAIEEYVDSRRTDT
jgi:acyl carrier protein